MSEPEAASEGGMERRLGLPAVIAICTGAMFSSGFFLLPGFAAAETGPSIPLTYLLAGVLVIPALLSLGELSSAMPRSGGPYVFLARGMGPLAGTLGALANYATLVFKGAFAFVGVGAYLSLVLDVPIAPVGIGLVAVFTALNLWGAGQTARVEIGLVVILLLLLGWFVLSGGIELAADGWGEAVAVDEVFPFGLDGFLAAVALVFVSYAGVGQVASVSEEVRDPGRTIPRGMLIALGVATLIYVGGTAVMVGLLEADALRGDPTPVATAAAELQVLPLPVMLVVVAALAAFASTGNAAILSAARFPLAMARDQLVWGGFSRLSERGVPRRAVLLTSGLLVAVILAFDVEGIARQASAFLLLVFTGVCVAVVVFRESGAPGYEPSFRSPLYPWIHLAGAAAYLVLIAESGWTAIGLTAALLLAGGGWYGLVVRHRISPSGAIYRLLARMAGSARGTTEEGAAWLAEEAGHPMETLVSQAMVVDLTHAEGIEEVVGHAAEALADRVGGDEEELHDALMERIRPWASPFEGGMAVAPVLLEEIRQPEMVLARVKEGVEVGDRRAVGFLFVADDRRASARLLDLISRLTAAVERPGFRARWRDARNPRELRATLDGDARTITVEIGDRWAGTAISNLDLPDGSLVALIRRDGGARVPRGSDRLEEGDRVTLLVEAEMIDEVRRVLS